MGLAARLLCTAAVLSVPEQERPSVLAIERRSLCIHKQRLSFVHNMHREYLERFVADHLVARVRHFAGHNSASGAGELPLRLTWNFDRCTFEYVKGLLAVVKMLGRADNGTYDPLHRLQGPRRGVQVMERASR